MVSQRKELDDTVGKRRSGLWSGSDGRCLWGPGAALLVLLLSGAGNGVLSLLTQCCTDGHLGVRHHGQVGEGVGVKKPASHVGFAVECWVLCRPSASLDLSVPSCAAERVG